MYSDSDSVDSDDGIRFKTDSIRNKLKQSSGKCCRSNRDSYKTEKRRKSPQNYRKRSEIHKNEDRNTTKRRRRSKSKERCTKSPKSLAIGPQKITCDLPSTSEKSAIGLHPKNNTSATERPAVGPELPPHLKIGNSELPSTGGFQIGPELPPHLKNNTAILETPTVGPELPPLFKVINSESSRISVGPELPDYLKNTNSESVTSSGIGPELPFYSGNSRELSKMIGPELPPDFTTSKLPQQSVIGPELPPHLKTTSLPEMEEEDDEIYGPLPMNDENQSKAHLALEERALQLKLEQLEPNEQKEAIREEWMLELPEAKAQKFGLGPRQFRSKTGPDLTDRSSWTKIPGQKVKEATVDLKKEAELKQIQKRDKQQEEMSKKHKKHKKSLVEIHQKKTKKVEEGPSERRPFNRETDLQVNRFDEAQKKAVLKKAQLLDSRFSTGQSKFL